MAKWQSFEKITSSDFPLSICLGDKYAISIQFESKKNTGKLFSPPPQCSITLQKAKLQPPQNPWKHDKVDANKRGQRTDFPGPIIGENLLRNSWLGPEEK